MDCHYNQLTSLDVSSCTSLSMLNCDGNQLTILNVRKNNAVFELSQYTAIPDKNFEQALIELGYDDTVNGKVLTANISNVDSLYLQKKKIKDLKGIEAFTALTHLNCGWNQLTSLDLSKNTALTSLDCYNNQLTSLDIGNNTALKYLGCSKNNLDCDALKANLK